MPDRPLLNRCLERHFQTSLCSFPRPECIDRNSKLQHTTNNTFGWHRFGNARNSRKWHPGFDNAQCRADSGWPGIARSFLLDN